jgi:hypothetical protein
VAPGRIQAEYFDNGPQFTAYYDTTPANEGGAFRNTMVDIENSVVGGYNVGWLVRGEWMSYTVNVAESGVYRVDWRVASAAPGGQVMLLMDNVLLVGPVAVPVTGGWQSFVTATDSALVSITAGTRVFKVFVWSAGFNLDYFDLVKVSSSTSVVPSVTTQTITYALIGNSVCEPGEDCFNAPSDCKSSTSGATSKRYCCSGNMPAGYLTGKGWSTAAGKAQCTPPPRDVLPSPK